MIFQQIKYKNISELSAKTLDYVTDDALSSVDEQQQTSPAFILKDIERTHMSRRVDWSSSRQIKQKHILFDHFIRNQYNNNYTTITITEPKN